jgi:hypothetical protein
MRFAEDPTWLHAQEITQSGDSGQRPKWAKEPADQPLVLTLLIVLILKLSNQKTEFRPSCYDQAHVATRNLLCNAEKINKTYQQE